MLPFTKNTLHSRGSAAFPRVAMDGGGGEREGLQAITSHLLTFFIVIYKSPGCISGALQNIILKNKSGVTMGERDE